MHMPSIGQVISEVLEILVRSACLLISDFYAIPVPTPSHQLIPRVYGASGYRQA